MRPLLAPLCSECLQRHLHVASLSCAMGCLLRWRPSLRLLPPPPACRRRLLPAHRRLTSVPACLRRRRWFLLLGRSWPHRPGALQRRALVTQSAAAAQPRRRCRRHRRRSQTALLPAGRPRKRCAGGHCGAPPPPAASLQPATSKSYAWLQCLRTPSDGRGRRHNDGRANNAERRKCKHRTLGGCERSGDKSVGRALFKGGCHVGDLELPATGGALAKDRDAAVRAHDCQQAAS